MFRESTQFPQITRLMFRCGFIGLSLASGRLGFEWYKSQGRNEKNQTEFVNVLPFAGCDHRVKKNDEMPLLGIRVSFLRQFISKHGVENLRGLTTADVCQKFIKPQTQSLSLSYTDMIQLEESQNQSKTSTSKSSVGQANVFLSHAWKYQFLEVAEAVFDHFEGKEYDTIIWFDIFSNNQHKSTERKFQWWTETFTKAVGKIHHTLIVLQPWDDPLPLTRAWCIWELYSTISTGATFEVCMSKNEKQKFLQDMKADAQFMMNRLAANIDSKNSYCEKEYDKTRIHEAIQASPHSFHDINRLIFQEIREWIVTMLKKEINRSKTVQEKLEYRNLLGFFYLYLDRFNEADHYLHENLKSCREVYGDELHDTIMTAESNLAYYYQKTGRYLDAETTLRELVRRKEVFFGVGHQKTILTYMQLAACLTQAGKLQLADQMYEKISKLLSTYDPRHPILLYFKKQLSGFHQLKGNTKQAEVLQLEVLDRMKEQLGETNPETLSSLNDLALIQSTIPGKENDAINTLLKVIEIEEVILPKDCLTILISKGNLAFMYYRIGNRQQASPLFSEISQKISLEEADHPDVLTFKNNYAMFLVDEGKLHEASLLFEEVLRTSIQRSGELSIETLAYKNNLGAFYRDHLRRFDLAETLIVDAVKGRTTVLGRVHELTLSSLHNLFGLYIEKMIF